MNLGELRARFRKDAKDTIAPYFWPDEDVDAWINEAQVEACRRALLLVDSTSAVTSGALSAGADVMPLDESVFFVRRVILGSTGLPLSPSVVRNMDQTVPGWESSQPSVPRVFIPDWQTNALKFWPPSQVADTVKMTVVRVPLEVMSADTDVPEIRSQYHVQLLDWVKFKAYSVPDADTFDPKKAEKHEKSFIANFGESAPINEHWALEQYYEVGAN